MALLDAGKIASERSEFTAKTGHSPESYLSRLVGKDFETASNQELTLAMESAILVLASLASAIASELEPAYKVDLPSGQLMDPTAIQRALVAALVAAANKVLPVVSWR